MRSTLAICFTIIACFAVVGACSVEISRNNRSLGHCTDVTGEAMACPH